jgi:Fe-S cluster biogenesis protein NfuA/nitrite reductase/ring-hydroxylating ferredoxin subunit
MEQPSVRESSARIDELLDELEQSAVPAVLERVQELLSCVMVLYGAGLERTVDLVLESGRRDLARRLADDEIVGNLLVLHDLHPDDVLTRVNDALERVRPYLGSHAGGVELLGVDEAGIAHVRLQGSCDGCPSSALTVASAIEDAILQAAPDVVAVEAEGMVEPSPSLLQIAPFTPHENIAQAADHWHALDLDVPPRTTRRVDVAEEHLLVANLDGTLVAYLDRCPSCQDPMSDGVLDGDGLTCSGCATTYDVRLAGRAHAAELQLTPVPLLPERGAWKVALPATVTA